MNTSAMTTLFTGVVITTLLGCASGLHPDPPVAEREPMVVFLVRHAEKAEEGADPGLTDAGRERAGVLATILRNAAIEHVHSSDFARTRETAAPVAAEYGVDLELYDPRDLPTLVEALRGAGGRHLVVGHSNTTPEMVELLGGAPGPAIDEAAEFDRLYIVTIGRDGTVSSVLLRFGGRYDPERM